jgi:peptidyl-tRNA hydrolase, PTH1 family
MQLWTGLGNPGADYAGHRHNVGFMAVDAIAAEHRFTPWKAGFRGAVSEGRIAGEKLLLLKPATFMNESGRAIAEAMRFYKLALDDLTVFYDELDLAPFKVKVRIGGGTAGHNGIRSTVAHVGAEFRRVRIGIGHPGHKDRVTSHVLGNFAKAEADRLSQMLNAIAADAHWLAARDNVRFMSDVARRLSD